MTFLRLALCCAVASLAAPSLRAEYIALRSGQRLHVTGYQLVGDRYILQIGGGKVEVAASEVVAIEPEDVFAPLPPAPATAATAPYRDLVKAAAAHYAIDEELISSVIAAESNFDPKAISKRNARGLMQLLPETAAQFGVRDIFDPKENIDAGTHYLSDLLKRYNNDLALALAAYNAGPERVEQFGRVPPYSETVSYIRRVKKSYEQSKSGQAPLSAEKSPGKAKNASPAQNAAAGSVATQPSVPN